MSEKQANSSDEAPPDLAEKPLTPEEKAQNASTNRALKWGLGVVGLIVLAFMIWATTLLVRASSGRKAAGEDPDSDNPWQHNPYTSAAPSGTAAPEGPSRGK